MKKNQSERSNNNREVPKVNDEIVLSKEDKDNLFTTEIFPHINALHNFAYMHTQHREDAEDLVNETFYKAYNSINTFKQGTNAKAWLFTILRNHYINDFRKTAKKPKHIEIKDDSKLQDKVKDNSNNNRQSFDDNYHTLIGDEVLNALNSLKEKYKTIILLSDLEDFTYEEIAKIENIPLGTVRSRLHRSRMILKEKLSSYGRENGYTD